ncbi:MAG TPA: DNA alkylation repair protein [Bacteroidales bacterium]|nr:DNA alkylation repair protein [Bacteroidales bacterium]HPS73799.1 DNA alkylation repair protein [Bacteroidales bacterium]
MENIISNVRAALIGQSDEKTKTGSQHFFKETITCHGVKTKAVQQISKEMFSRVRTKTKQEIFALCDRLWESGYLEESFIACNWAYALRKQFEPSDFPTFERWIFNHVNNWASCDTLCNHTVGDFIVMYPEYLNNLKDFARSENRWMRRASAVSLIVPAKKGKFLKEVMEIADILLLDEDDMVQKGYGWMLKVASQAHQKEIFSYVVRNKAAMPRTALRYAIEKMPAEMKKAAMVK